MSESISTILAIPVALAAVATIGYLVGRQQNKGTIRKLKNLANHEMKRAKAVVKDLERVTQHIRDSLRIHRGRLQSFKARVVELGKRNHGEAWKELAAEAEKILKPTMELSRQIAQAYDEIRQQTSMLLTFTEVRTDPGTGLCNRRAMDESLGNMFAMSARYHTTFSIAMFDLDHFKKINDEQGHLAGDEVLLEFAQILAKAARVTDVVTRYGGEEFLVIMPQTGLDSACVFAERVRKSVSAQLPVTVSSGTAVALAGEDPPSLIARADAALYSAKESGRNRTYQHTGNNTQPVKLRSPTEGSNEKQCESDTEQEERELGRILTLDTICQEIKS